MELIVNNLAEILRSPIGNSRLPEISYITRPLLSLHGRLVKTREMLNSQDRNFVLKLMDRIQIFILSITIYPPLYILTAAGLFLYRAEEQAKKKIIGFLNMQMFGMSLNFLSIYKDLSNHPNLITFSSAEIKIGNKVLVFKNECITPNDAGYILAVYQKSMNGLKSNIQRAIENTNLYFPSYQLDSEQATLIDIEQATLEQTDDPNVVNVTDITSCFTLEKSESNKKAWGRMSIGSLSTLPFKHLKLPSQISFTPQN